MPWKTETIPPEYTCATIYGSAGDVVWNTVGNEEVILAHGAAQYRWRFGPLVCNLFAKITDNLEELDSICNEIQRKGTKKVSLREIP